MSGLGGRRTPLAVDVPATRMMDQAGPSSPPKPLSPSSARLSPVLGSASISPRSGDSDERTAAHLHMLRLSERVAPAPQKAAVSIQALYRGYVTRKFLKDRVLKTGYLFLQHDEQWQRFWFVLRYFYLVFFESTASSAPAGSIALESCQVYEEVQDDDSGAVQPNCFAVHAPEGVRMFWADSPDERLEWIQALRTARIIKCGSLYKHSVPKGGTPKPDQWHRRWFVLQRRSLGLFRREAVRVGRSVLLGGGDNSPHADTERLAVLDLRGARVNAVPPSGVRYTFAFVLHAVTEDLYLAAESLQEKMEWVNAISQMILNLPS